MSKKLKKSMGLLGLMLLLVFGCAVSVQAAPEWKPTKLSYVQANYPTTQYILTWNTGGGDYSYFDYQVLLGKKVVKSGVSYTYYAYVSGLSATKAYKFRVRAELYNPETYSYEPGPWSSKCTILPQATLSGGKSKNKISGGKLKLRIKRIPGIQKYEIYVSTKKSSGYKKVKTVTQKQAKKTITINKFKNKKFKNNKYYYIKIVSVVKTKGKTVRSKDGGYYYIYRYHYRF